MVWEESIVMLPSQVRFVFLSATIPNATEFASWVSKVHNSPTNVVYTDFRPTPLQHYMFPSGGEGLYLVMDGHQFKADNFSKVVAEVELIGKQAAPGSAGSGGRARKSQRGGNNAKGKQGGDSDIFKVVKMLMERNMDPCIVFAFSKRETESLALQMTKLDFNTDDEKALVEQVFINAVDSLSEDDRRLPQIEHILPLLKRGIGMHHSGLLPILKEVPPCLRHNYGAGSSSSEYQPGLWVCHRIHAETMDVSNHARLRDLPASVARVHCACSE